MPNKLPKQITVLNVTYDVKEYGHVFQRNTADGDEINFGFCDVASPVIGVYQYLPPDTKRETFWHEIFHAVNFAMGLDDDSKEELHVANFTRGFLTLMRDNPELVDWL